MSYSFIRAGSIALLGVLAARGVQAEVTAEQVWSQWRDYLQGLGYEVSGRESGSGGTLVIRDFALSMDMPEDSGEISVEAAQIVFSENGDGTVSVILPENLPVQFRATGEEEVIGRIETTQAQPELIVSGTPDDTTYRYTSSQMSISLGSVTINGAPVPEDVMRAEVRLAEVKTETRILTGAARSYSQVMSAGSVEYDLAFRDPESGDAGSLAGRLEGVAFEGTGRLPLKLDEAAFANLLAAGFGFDGTWSVAEGSTQITTRGDGQEFSYSGRSQGGMFRAAMDAGRLIYQISQKAPRIEMLSSAFPVPIVISLDEVGFALDIPAVKTDSDQPFSLGVTVSGFAVPDMLWSMFDPGAVLPREPVTLIVDIAGRARLFQDFLDVEAAKKLEETGAPPGEVTALSIRELLVSAVGARLTGTGDFTLDNSDLESFDGMPRPTGTLKLRVDGANALIDRLIQMGVVSDEDAMGARMMLGMLTVPGEAPDSLNSTIEINEQGQIFANGQRIK